MSFIIMKNIHKIYKNGQKELRVLKGINLTIEKGKTIAIIGASGAGKSTLLHILGTIDQPTEGELFYNQQNVFSYDNKKLASFRNKNIGFVFQFHHLLPEFSALENIMMPILINRKSLPEAKEKALQLLDDVGLSSRENHKPGELSGGEQQRVAIARALSNNPELLLADEPTGNLDSNTSNKIFQVLNTINKEYSVTMIVVTHNHVLGESTDFCLKMVDGRLE